MTKLTIKSLQAEVAALTARVETQRACVREANEAKNEAEAIRDSVHGQFADLKKRLHSSEMEVARLTGYLARVREDDVVREELVTVGEPGGEQRMVPKRKPEYLGNREPNHSAFDCMTDDYGRKKAQPKHWIEY